MPERRKKFRKNQEKTESRYGKGTDVQRDSKK